MDLLDRLLEHDRWATATLLEVVHMLQRPGLSGLPEIDHALWDVARRGLYQPEA
jgi:hypothetical protein